MQHIICMCRATRDSVTATGAVPGGGVGGASTPAAAADGQPLAAPAATASCAAAAVHPCRPRRWVWWPPCCRFGTRGRTRTVGRRRPAPQRGLGC